MKILGEINLSKEKLKLIKERIDKGYTVSKAGTTIYEFPIARPSKRKRCPKNGGSLKMSLEHQDEKKLYGQHQKQPRIRARWVMWIILASRFQLELLSVYKDEWMI